MKIVDTIAERDKKDNYLKSIYSIFKRLGLFRISFLSYPNEIYLKPKKWFRSYSYKARICISYSDNLVEVAVADLTNDELISIKSALKEVESLRKKTKVILMIVEEI